MSWIALTAVSCAWLVWCERRSSPARWVAKPLASLGFVALALSRADTDLYGAAIVIGAALGMAGDVALLGHGRKPFLAGLSLFLLGHVAYLVAFASEASASWLIIGAIPALALGAGSWRWLAPHLEGGMAPAVAAYVVVISTMLAAAVGVAPDRPSAAAGAALFAVSDMAVARDNFVVRGWANRAVGLPLYYAGQLLIALSI